MRCSGAGRGCGGSTHDDHHDCKHQEQVHGGRYEGSRAAVVGLHPADFLGRKEMVIFFYIYMLCVLLELLLATNVFPLSAALYKVPRSNRDRQLRPVIPTLPVRGGRACSLHHLGRGGPVYEWLYRISMDGGRHSSQRLGKEPSERRDGRDPAAKRPTPPQTFRIAALIAAGASYFVAISTFMGVAGMSPKSPMVLYILMFIFNGAVLFLYVALQVFLVLSTLRDRWPLGMILHRFNRRRAVHHSSVGVG